MHNKEKSKSTSNLLKKSNPSSPVKNEVGESSEMDEKSPSNLAKQNSPTVHHRPRAKRSSSHHHSLLSTVSSVHELMSFVIYKDRPPQWLKQTDLYREYLNKSAQLHHEAQSSESHPQFHQPSHRKQRSNLHLYAQLDSSPTKVNGFTSLNGSIKQENFPLASPAKKRKNSSSSKTRRQEQVLCKKVLEENGSTPRRARRARSNSVENQEPIEKKDSSSSSSSSSSLSQLDSSNASVSSIEHTSPSPTTTVSHHSSPVECMRRGRTSPMRSFSPPPPPPPPTSTTQRRSTRLWAPSNFYIDPMWILSSGSSTKRNQSFSSTTESTKRSRRRCRS